MCLCVGDNAGVAGIPSGSSSTPVRLVRGVLLTDLCVLFVCVGGCVHVRVCMCVNRHTGDLYSHFYFGLVMCLCLLHHQCVIICGNKMVIVYIFVHLFSVCGVEKRSHV